ncbi:helix-turn-helix domain-containing protein, partial [Streptomyces goshikiensis]|uniref:helix-turn-helix transcriptional regulator n=1 Tax=Streptomyces goshikiensis TaxID=1942 RepID=UPI003692C792
MENEQQSLFAAVDALLEEAAAQDPLPHPDERKRLREAAGLSQDQIAKALSVRRETVTSWETGRTAPRPPKRAAYARLLEGLATLHPINAVNAPKPPAPTVNAVNAVNAAPSPAPTVSAQEPLAPPVNGVNAAPSPAPTVNGVNAVNAPRAEGAAVSGAEPQPAGAEGAAPTPPGWGGGGGGVLGCKKNKPTHQNVIRGVGGGGLG